MDASNNFNVRSSIFHENMKVWKRISQQYIECLRAFSVDGTSLKNIEARKMKIISLGYIDY